MDKIIKTELNCEMCDRVYKTKAGLISHIRKEHKLIDTEIIDYKQSYLNNVTTLSDIKKIETMKKTMIERYGVESTFQSEEIKSKIKKTNIERYGVENPLQSEKIKQKVKQTNIERYGSNWGLSSKTIQDKIHETNKKKYGGIAPACDKQIVEKMKDTSIDKYGCWFSQTEEHHKSNYQWKDYVLPSGKIIKCQGYEPWAMDLLTKEYDESNLIIDTPEITIHIGEIWYEFDNKQHRYFPDIYINTQNTIIEVKSEYTYSQQKKKNQKKKEATENMNIKHRYLVFNKTGDLILNELHG